MPTFRTAIWTIWYGQCNTLKEPFLSWRRHIICNHWIQTASKIKVHFFVGSYLAISCSFSLQMHPFTWLILWRKIFIIHVTFNMLMADATLLVLRRFYTFGSFFTTFCTISTFIRIFSGVTMYSTTCWLGVINHCTMK